MVINIFIKQFKEFNILLLYIIMSSSNTTSPTNTSPESRVNGQVKWFNTKAGYGFIASEGKEDIFVHHSGLNTGNDQFRYLVQGEYVEFVVIETDDGRETASDVTGCNRGKLMCEVRQENADESRGSSRNRGGGPRYRGGGPRNTRDKIQLNGDTIWEGDIKNKNKNGRVNKRKPYLNP